ncbi:MAG: mandelate racemase/muconate lactonizing enzyme family protein, partial [Acidobacteriota bacterium]
MQSVSRSSLFSSPLADAAGAAPSRADQAAVAEQEPAIRNVNTHSSPSELKITDLRYALVVKPGPSPCPIIRIDTNQGVYGLGEVRDVAGPQYALVLKSRLLGENP